MLLKLFRHDFRALARWQVPVIIGIGGAALLGFLNMLLLGWSDVPYGEQSAGRNMMRTTAVGGTVLVFMALLIAATVAAVLLFVRFYKSMVTDEAYLTFTLPVTAGQLIGAKFLSALVWTVIAGAVIAASWGVIFGGVMISGGADFREGIGEIVKEMFEAIGENFGTAFLIGLYMAASLIRGWFQITCAILFGASVVRKNKALAAVGDGDPGARERILVEKRHYIAEDLIRYNRFTTSDYVWQWKGGTHDGQSVEEYKNLYPIPVSDMMVNPNLEQNPGYKK